MIIAGGAWLWTGDPIRAVAVLVVATPCPLILAVPVAIVSGLSRAAKQGILIKGGKALEMLARIRALVIDKTGTLTDGRARVVSVHAMPGFSEDEIIRIAASLDQVSQHIIAQTIVAEAQSRQLHLAVPTGMLETAGEGVEGQVDGRPAAVGGVAFVDARIAVGSGGALERSPTPGAVRVAVANSGLIQSPLTLTLGLAAEPVALANSGSALA
eukprot:gene66867-91579_t